MIGEALRKEMKVAKMGYDELETEYNLLAGEIDQEALTENDIETIKALAQEIRQRLIEPT